MKPYGCNVIENPDVSDIKKMGAKSSVGKFKEKCGDFKSYSRSKSKAATRRVQKKRARSVNKKITYTEINN